MNNCGCKFWNCTVSNDACSKTIMFMDSNSQMIITTLVLVLIMIGYWYFFIKEARGKENV